MTEINYPVPRLNIEGQGVFENVRLEARPEHIKRLDEWKWSDNPFVETKELQGWIIMMALLNNWDIKDTNNKILHVRNEANGRDELQYIVSDLGATFGKVKTNICYYLSPTRSLLTSPHKLEHLSPEIAFVRILLSER